MKLSKLIGEYMQKNGIKPAEFVRRTGLSYAYLWALRGGSRIPRQKDTLMKISDGLGIPYDILKEVIIADTTEFLETKL